MSNLKHATVSAWQRDHDGTYSAEINGYQLKVFWQPESDREPRGFRWTADSPDGEHLENRETHEEIEIAMAEAEAATEPSDEQGAEEAA
jgi:hypothetical protein